MPDTLIENKTSTGPGSVEAEVLSYGAAGLNVDISGTAEVQLEAKNEVTEDWVPVFDSPIASSQLVALDLPQGRYRANVVSHSSGRVDVVLHTS